MKYAKKLGALMLALALVLSVLTVPAEVRAAGKTAMNKTKATLSVGETLQLKVKNAPKGKTIQWSSSKKTVASVTKKGKVTAKKAGKAKITAKVNKKSYSCTVTVKSFALSNTKGKNAADVKALTNIIQKQNANGAKLPTDLNSGEYGWDENGNLTELNWGGCELSGSLSLEGLSSLQRLECMYNSLSSLNVSGNPELYSLNCFHNQLTSLDVSKNPKLEYLTCYENQLSSLDVSKNPELNYLSCSSNQISVLDVSKNPKLTEDLYCDTSVSIKR